MPDPDAASTRRGFVSLCIPFVHGPLLLLARKQVNARRVNRTQISDRIGNLETCANSDLRRAAPRLPDRGRSGLSVQRSVGQLRTGPILSLSARYSSRQAFGDKGGQVLKPNADDTYVR